MSSQLELNTVKINTVNQNINDFFSAQNNNAAQKPLGSIFLKQYYSSLTNFIEYNNKIIAVIDNILMYSIDGENWIIASTELTGSGEVFMTTNHTSVVLVSNYTDKKVLYSTDGINWQVVLQDKVITGLFYINNYFFALTNEGNYYISQDGYTWTVVVLSSGETYLKLISYDNINQQYMVIDTEEDYYTHNIYTFSNPINLTDLLIWSNDEFSDISQLYNFKGVWLLTTEMSGLYYSIDSGATWDYVTYLEDYNDNSVQFLQTQDVIAFNDGNMACTYLYSIDGINWQSPFESDNGNGYFQSPTINNQTIFNKDGVFIGCLYTFDDTISSWVYGMYTSTNLIDWTKITNFPATQGAYSYSNGIHMFTTGTDIYISENGYQWIKSNLSNLDDYNFNHFFVCLNGKIIISLESGGIYTAYQLEN